MFGFACGNVSPSMAEEAAKRVPAPGETMQPEQDRGDAVLAGGCFWCVEAVFERVDGVKQVVSGYAGGEASTADYETVSSGGTDHAEVVRVTYDPQKVGYAQLLQIFFATHDPTQKNRQGPDVGRQYRSAVFYADEHQKRVAEAYIAQLNESDAFSDPVVTTVEALNDFFPAEKYHQDFVAQNRAHPYVQQWALPKLKKLEKQFPEQLKED